MGLPDSRQIFQDASHLWLQEELLRFANSWRACTKAHCLNANPDKHQLFHETRAARQVSRRDFVRLPGVAGLATFAGGANCPLQAPGNGAGRSHIRRAGRDSRRRDRGTNRRLPIAESRRPFEIFEAAERTGGRMFAKRDFNSEGMFCELGGELVDSNHADLIASSPGNSVSRSRN